MADLGELLGTILASLSHARRMSDEATAALAEYYRAHPLLEGLSVPRVRVPEMRLEIPVVIESHQPGGASILNEPSTIRDAVLHRLDSAATGGRVEWPQGFRQAFSVGLDRELSQLASASSGASAEAVVRAVEKSFADASAELRRQGAWKLDARRVAPVLKEIRVEAADRALKTVGERPRLEAIITTGEVKERAGDATVTRLSIVLREEGLEWSVAEEEDGRVSRKLTPE